MTESVEARLARELRERLYPLLHEQWVLDAFSPRRLADAAAACMIDYFTLGGKYCYACQKTRPKGEFGPNATKRDGLQNVCRECRRSRQRTR